MGCSTLVGRNEFWEPAINALEDVIKQLDTGTCSTPLNLYNIARKAGINPERLRAPNIISIDSLRELPRPLKKNLLYVIRLGQWHSGRAEFTICKASPGYHAEVISIKDVLSTPKLPVEPVKMPKWLLNIAMKIDTEALTFLAAGLLVEALAHGERAYILPSLRIGRAVFDFKPTPHGNILSYDGQVEVDAVLGKSFVFALEAKSLEKIDAIFKYKIAFSAQALANLVQQEVHPLISTIVRSGDKKRTLVTAVLLAPPARPGSPYIINSMKPYARLEQELLH